MALALCVCVCLFCASERRRVSREACSDACAIACDVHVVADLNRFTVRLVSESRLMCVCVLTCVALGLGDWFPLCGLHRGTFAIWIDLVHTLIHTKMQYAYALFFGGGG